MLISELLQEDAGLKGVNIKGTIAGVWPQKQSPYGPTQFFLVSDGKDIVGVQAREVSLSEADKGKNVEIMGGTWKSYESKGKTKHILEVPKNKSAGIRVKTGASPAPTQETKMDLESIKTEILNEYKESLIKSMELLGDEVVSQMLTVCKEKGWETKDVTAVAASLYIELNKKKHIADMRR